MRLAVIIRSEQKEGLPTAAELRRAGFAVSTALGPDGGPDNAGRIGQAGLPVGGRGEPGGTAPERAGPPGRLPEQQRP